MFMKLKTAKLTSSQLDTLHIKSKEKTSLKKGKADDTHERLGVKLVLRRF
jgi:hypothetical protein